MDPKHPEKLADRYQVIDIIGSGGVGTVYRAIDPVLNKEVAVKVLKHNSDETTTVRLQREAMAAGKLNHPHICRIDNFGQTQDGSPYMVMEYLSGHDLATHIKSNDALDLPSALEIAIQICGALSYAHKHGIIHRDLKPANVLLLDTKNDDIFTKLLDFGVASLESKRGDLTEIGAIVGSPLYMSPEQVKGEEVQAASDIYSFGCMLFEMLTGKPPLKGESLIETLALHKNAQAPLLSDYGDFPPLLVTLVKDCLAKDPAARPQSVSDVLSKLEIIQQEVLNPKESSAPVFDAEAALKEQRKKRTIVVSALLVGSLVVVGLGLIIKDVFSRKAIPSQGLYEPAFDGVTDNYFGDEKDPSLLFHPDGDQSGGIRMRAVPDVTDDDMKALKGKHFERLCLDGAPINGSGLKYILDSGVEVLSLELTRITDENTHYLSELKRLRSVSLYSDVLTDAGIEPMSDLKRFTMLEFGSDNITDDGIAHFKNMNNITFLHLRGSKLTVNCLKSQSKLDKLKTLTLDKMVIKGDLSGINKNFPMLSTFSMENPLALDPKAIESLSTTKIQSLRFYNTKMNHEQFQAITNLSQLKSLTFSNTEFDGEYFAELARMKNLYNLNLQGMKKISDKSIEDICKLKQVTQLEFVRSDITQKNLMKLLSHPALLYLNFHDCIQINSDMTDEFKQAYKSQWGHDVVVFF